MKPEEIFEKSDKELVQLSQVYETGEHTRSLARAEQLRRQTIAIQKFNTTSTWLTIAMLILAVVVGWDKLLAFLLWLTSGLH